MLTSAARYRTLTAQYKVLRCGYLLVSCEFEAWVTLRLRYLVPSATRRSWTVK